MAIFSEIDDLLFDFLKGFCMVSIPMEDKFLV